MKGMPIFHYAPFSDVGRVYKEDSEGNFKQGGVKDD